MYYRDNVMGAPLGSIDMLDSLPAASVVAPVAVATGAVGAVFATTQSKTKRRLAVATAAAALLWWFMRGRGMGALPGGGRGRGSASSSSGYVAYRNFHALTWRRSSVRSDMVEYAFAQLWTPGQQAPVSIIGAGNTIEQRYASFITLLGRELRNAAGAIYIERITYDDDTGMTRSIFTGNEQEGLRHSVAAAAGLPPQNLIWLPTRELEERLGQRIR